MCLVAMAGAKEGAGQIEMSERPLQRGVIVEGLSRMTQVGAIGGGSLVPLFGGGIGLGFNEKRLGDRGERVGAEFSRERIGGMAIGELDGASEKFVGGGQEGGIGLLLVELIEFL